MFLMSLKVYEKEVFTKCWQLYILKDGFRTMRVLISETFRSMRERNRKRGLKSVSKVGNIGFLNRRRRTWILYSHIRLRIIKKRTL